MDEQEGKKMKEKLKKNLPYIIILISSIIISYAIFNLNLSRI